jgi:hypothetical protein
VVVKMHRSHDVANTSERYFSNILVIGKRLEDRMRRRVGSTAASSSRGVWFRS